MRRTEVRVASGRYDVLVGRGCLEQLGAQLRLRHAGAKVVIVSDANVAPLYLDASRESLVAAGYEASQVVVPSGEAQKTLARTEELYGVLYDRAIRRGDVVIALGGGVVGDLAGWVAATYLRGIPFVQVPTTLLSQVDSSVGGKVAVDFRVGKNYIGTFYQPLFVFADLSTLDTLPLRELRAGAAEAAKMGLCDGGNLLLEVEGLARASLSSSAVTDDLIVGCVQRKAAVVARDERDELGHRAVLNLGHTIGHALEAATGFRRYTHGEAVGLGLRAALRLSRELCGLSAKEEERGIELLDRLGLPTRFKGASPTAVCDLIARDKKAGERGVAFVLLEALGRPVLNVEVPLDLQRRVVTWLRGS